MQDFSHLPKKTIPFSFLKGKILREIEKDKNDDYIMFLCHNGERYLLHHYQDCCESVYVEDITGDLDDLIGTPILLAEESSNHKESEEGDSSTWTFYKISTNKGSVTIRWYGTSNGYYSEEVDFSQLPTIKILSASKKNQELLLQKQAKIFQKGS